MKINLCGSSSNPEVKILDIEGRVDSGTCTILQNEISALFDMGFHKLVCNLNLMEYIGHAGLQLFLDSIQHVRQHGGDIKLCCLPNHIQNKFELAGFRDVSCFYQEMDEAVQAFGGNTGYAQDLMLNQEDVAQSTPTHSPSEKRSEKRDKNVITTKIKEVWRPITAELERAIKTKIAALKQEGSPETEASSSKCFSYSLAYYIHRKISEGNLGKLYYGEEKSAYNFARPVALRYLKTECVRNQEVMKLLTREIRKVARITHQNIAQTYKLVSWDGYYFIVMEYVDGSSVKSMLEQLKLSNRLFPPQLATLLVYNLCIALSYANRKADEEGTVIDVVHGDISPESVMVNKDGDVKLLNLGVSNINMVWQLQQRERLQHLEYLAPELLATGVPSKLGDIFALGVLLYEMLTGIPPFSSQEILRGSLEQPVLPSSFNPKITDTLEKIVLRCLLQDPQWRFQDYQDLALQLEETLHTKGFSLVQVSLTKFLENNKFW